MRIGKAHALVRYTIQVRRRNLGCWIVALNIAKTQVVGQNHYDVWLFGSRLASTKQAEQKEQEVRTHTVGQVGHGRKDVLQCLLSENCGFIQRRIWELDALNSVAFIGARVLRSVIS